MWLGSLHQVWTKLAERILEPIGRYCVRISRTAHWDEIGKRRLAALRRMPGPAGGRSGLSEEDLIAPACFGLVEGMIRGLGCAAAVSVLGEADADADRRWWGIELGYDRVAYPFSERRCDVCGRVRE